MKPSSREQVLRKIARKSYCSWELRQKCADIEGIDDLIAEFMAKGYLNDEEWLTNFIQAKEAAGLGPMALAMKLRQKGVPAAIIQAKIAALSPEEALRHYLQKKTRGRIAEKIPKTGPERQKLIASLLRRGFPFDAIKDLID